MHRSWTILDWRVNKPRITQKKNKLSTLYSSRVIVLLWSTVCGILLLFTWRIVSPKWRWFDWHGAACVVVITELLVHSNNSTCSKFTSSSLNCLFFKKSAIFQIMLNKTYLLYSYFFVFLIPPFSANRRAWHLFYLWFILRIFISRFIPTKPVHHEDAQWFSST